jgi:endonuclease YncB( thermonuclease family)
VCWYQDATVEQACAGMAWAYKRYRRTAELWWIWSGQARAERRGLWGDPTPEPPWEWRSASRRCPSAVEVSAAQLKNRSQREWGQHAA